MIRLGGVVLTLALASASGCTTAPPTIGDPAPTVKDKEAEHAYREILETYSDSAEIYSRFDTQAFTGATFQSWPFRQARVQRMAQFKEMSPQELQQHLAEERAEFEQFNVFDLGTWTQNPKFDDFDTKNSIWRIALVTGKGQVLPAEVRRVGRVNLNTRALYPYMGTFWVQYRVKFPKLLPDGTPVIPPGENQVILRVASTLGQADLHTAAQ